MGVTLVQKKGFKKRLYQCQVWEQTAVFCGEQKLVHHSVSCLKQTQSYSITSLNLSFTAKLVL